LKAEVVAEQLGEPLVDVFDSHEKHRLARVTAKTAVGKYRRDDHRSRPPFNGAHVGNGAMSQHLRVAQAHRGLDDIVRGQFSRRVANRLEQILQPAGELGEVRLRIFIRHEAEHRRVVGRQYVDLIIAEKLRQVLAVERTHPGSVARPRTLVRFRPHGLHAQLTRQRQPVLVKRVLDRLALPGERNAVGLPRAEHQ